MNRTELWSSISYIVLTVLFSLSLIVWSLTNYKDLPFPTLLQETHSFSRNNNNAKLHYDVGLETDEQAVDQIDTENKLTAHLVTEIFAENERLSNVYDDLFACGQKGWTAPSYGMLLLGHLRSWNYTRECKL